MAKRALRAPAVPEGSSRMEFFTAMQRLVLESGDLSVQAISRLMARPQCSPIRSVSHQSIYTALVGPKMPSYATAQSIVILLGGTWDSEIKDLWIAAVQEERTKRNRKGASGGDVLTAADLAREEGARRLNELRSKLGDPPMRRIAKTATEAGFPLSPSTVHSVLTNARLPPRKTLYAVLRGMGASDDDQISVFEAYRDVLW